MGINVGGALGPIICGLVGDTGNPEDFKWAFLAGGIAMLISVVVQLVFHKKYVLDPDKNILGLTPANAPAAWTRPLNIIAGLTLLAAVMIAALYIDTRVVDYLTYVLIASPILIGSIIFSDKTLSKIEKQRVAVIFRVSGVLLNKQVLPLLFLQKNKPSVIWVPLLYPLAFLPH